MLLNRILVATLALAMLMTVAAPAGALAGVPGVRGPDGITAWIRPVHGNDQVFLPDANGNYVVEVQVYQKGADAAWRAIDLWVTLRAFTWDPVAGEQDRLSKPFRADADGFVTVTFPASALDQGESFDLFVTFSQLGGNPVPTSHHSAAKNALLAHGDLDGADALDYHHVVNPIAG